MKKKQFEIGECVLIKAKSLGETNYEDRELEGEIICKCDLPDDAIYDVFVREKSNENGTDYGMTFRRYEQNIYKTHEELVKGQIKEISNTIKEKQEQIKLLKNIKEELKNKLK